MPIMASIVGSSAGWPITRTRRRTIISPMSISMYAPFFPLVSTTSGHTPFCGGGVWYGMRRGLCKYVCVCACMHAWVTLVGWLVEYACGLFVRTSTASCSSSMSATRQVVSPRYALTCDATSPSPSPMSMSPMSMSPIPSAWSIAPSPPCISMLPIDGWCWCWCCCLLRACVSVQTRCGGGETQVQLRTEGTDRPTDPPCTRVSPGAHLPGAGRRPPTAGGCWPAPPAAAPSPRRWRSWGPPPPAAAWSRSRRRTHPP